MSDIHSQETHDEVIERLGRKNDDLEDIMARYTQQKLYIAELEKELTAIANIAHHGGLTGLGDNDIRRLTLPYWDKAECERLQAQHLKETK